MKIRFSLLVSLLFSSSCSPAPVPHGKVGLWNFTLTLKNVNAGLSPQVRAGMAMMGMPVPDSQTHDVQICMTEAQVKAGDLPPINPPDSGCTGKTAKNDAGTVAAAMTCTGSMKGTGQLDIRYADTEHYAGTYKFSGTTEGKNLTLDTSFKALWVKADCGAVAP